MELRSWLLDENDLAATEGTAWNACDLAIATMMLAVWRVTWEVMGATRFNIVTAFMVSSGGSRDMEGAR